MLLFAAAAMAAPHLAVTVTAPDGQAVIDTETPLPFTARYDDDGAAKPRPLTIDAAVVAGRTLITARVLKVKKNGDKPLAAGEISLAPDEDGVVTVSTRLKGTDRRWTIAVRWAHLSPAPTNTPREGGSRYGLFWDDTRLTADPRSRGGGKQRRTDVTRTDPTTEASPLKIVYPWGTRAYEVETVARDLGPHCHVGAPAPDAGNMQYYAQSADMVPVLAEPVEHTTADGATVLLQPGLAVLDAGGGQHRVRHGDLLVTVPLDPSVIGDAYRPPARFPVTEGIDTLPAGPLADGVEAMEPVPVLGREGVRDARLVVGTSCLRVVLPGPR